MSDAYYVDLPWPDSVIEVRCEDEALAVTSPVKDWRRVKAFGLGIVVVHREFRWIFIEDKCVVFPAAPQVGK